MYQLGRVRPCERRKCCCWQGSANWGSVLMRFASLSMIEIGLMSKSGLVWSMPSRRGFGTRSLFAATEKFGEPTVLTGQDYRLKQCGQPSCAVSNRVRTFLDLAFAKLANSPAYVLSEKELSQASRS